MAGEKEYDFPVYGTQGGGLARRFGNHYFFVEVPADVPSLQIGDAVPAEWDIVPANEAARGKAVEDEFDEPFSDEEREYIRYNGLSKF